MGNAESRTVPCTASDFPVKQNISTARSNLILAMFQGRFYPCVIVRTAQIIHEGYTVYFFHNNIETEIPSTNIIGNLKALLNCEVSYIDENGANFKGVVRATDSDDDEERQPMNFFLSTEGSCKWVSLPYIYMTRDQAKIFL